MGIDKYKLHDWLYGKIAPEDLELEVSNNEHCYFKGDNLVTESYTYNFLDWLRGTELPNDLHKLADDSILNPMCYNNICMLQSLAYIIMLHNELWNRTNTIKERFWQSFMKLELLSEEILTTKDEIEEFKIKYPDVYIDALKGVDDRYSLSADEVKNTLSRKKFYYMGSDSAFEIIVKVKYFNWLIWFKDTYSAQTHEPSFDDDAKAHLYHLLAGNELLENHKEDIIPHWFYLLKQKGKYQPNITEEETSEDITWPQLFKDPKQADVILKLINEHISESGEWITGKANKYLVALCNELEEKGYFKGSNTITNPMKTKAFSQQFKINLITKIFQPGERYVAKDYQAYFNHIPQYKPANSVI